MFQIYEFKIDILFAIKKKLNLYDWKTLRFKAFKYRKWSF